MSVVNPRRVTTLENNGKMETHADLDDSRNRYWGGILAVVGTRQGFILVLIRWVLVGTSLVTNESNTLCLWLGRLNMFDQQTCGKNSWSED